MKQKRWLLLFALVCLLTAAALGTYNGLVDAFGVFGDPVLDDYAYDMTMNPRTAKIAYLEKYHDRYDSYVVGSSKASSLPVEELNRYLDASFFNMTWYGGKLWDEQRLINYLLDRYPVKNVVMTVEPAVAREYHTTVDDLKQEMHCAVSGESPLVFYAKHLFCNPAYSTDKLKAHFSRGFLQGADAVYVPETGAYNKQRRDAVRIADLESYLETEPGPFTVTDPPAPLRYIDESVEMIRQIKERCDREQVNFLMVVVPLSDEELAFYGEEDVRRLLENLAEVTDYWSFLGYHAVNRDPRFFYDSQHFRNCAGTMALARIFDDPQVYAPADFGVHLTAENCARELDRIFAAREDPPADDLAAQAQVLRIPAQTDPALVDRALSLLEDRGQSPVTFRDLEGYVLRGEDLPENPIALVAEEGDPRWLAELAAVLERHGATAACPAQALPPGWESAAAPEWDLAQAPGESEAAYVARLREALARAAGPAVLLYPTGGVPEIPEILAHEAGFPVTVRDLPGENELIRGVPQCLYQLRSTPLLVTLDDAIPSAKEE